MNFEHWRYTTRGWLFHFLGQTDLAFEAYVAAFHHAPDASAARNLGYLAARAKRWRESIHWFQEAVRLQPDDAETRFNLGFSLDQGGDPAGAAEAFAEAVRIRPNLDRAWYGLGMARAAQGRHGEAAAALEEAARLQPMAGEVWYQLGMAQHHALNPDRVKGVVEHLRAFDPRRSNQLIRDTERSDLRHLVQDLPF
ncbi:MAG: tetratricopeptide repeat protein [Betaproteobacteria bacterium]|nr:tetratricopeptide repeat protein [Betaproteobacteria bacterium]